MCFSKYYLTLEVSYRILRHQKLNSFNLRSTILYIISPLYSQAHHETVWKKATACGNQMVLCNSDILIIHDNPICYAIKGCINIEEHDR